MSHKVYTYLSLQSNFIDRYSH